MPAPLVAPSSNSSSMIVPEAGAGSSMSTLSVEISTTVSPSLTASPTFTDHSRIVPSVTDSPPVGVTMSTSVADPEAEAAPAKGAGADGAGAAAAGAGGVTAEAPAAAGAGGADAAGADEA